ncbi:hypothetical protein SAMN05421825_1292 [Epilithonimonas hungarica]|uniref:VWFA domain-containing protein n=2 Tax=Epilithonimonas hungarica TaxID=454006 RepID=A0A1G7J6K0_9FLAO|nr:hypothetical protein SAMN05421825_1292 [Epilithonimonas hungarica]
MKKVNKYNFLTEKRRFLFMLIFSLIAFHSEVQAQGVDAIFLLDNSSSIGNIDSSPLQPLEYPNMKKSTQDLIDKILACNPYNRVAVTQYGANGLDAVDSWLYIESDFTNNATAAKNFDRRLSGGTVTWGAARLIDNALCASCTPPTDIFDEQMILSSVKKLTRKSTNNLVIFLFTDGRPQDAAPITPEGDAYDFSEYNNLKTNRKATFVVLQAPSETNSIASNMAAAIASVGGSYTGWIEANVGDPQGSGVLPRKTVMSSTFDVSSIDINTLADNICISCTPIVAINTVTPTTQAICFNGKAQPLIADATGAGTLSYQWYSNTTSSTTGGTLIPGATSATFNPPTSVAATTYYYVMVSDTSCEGKATSPIVSVMVSSTPCPCSAGTVTPVLTNSTATSQAVDLAGMVTGTAPAGSVLQWHNSATPSDATLLSSTTVSATSTPTNYWAFYYDSTNKCYSPGAKVTVVSNNCTTNTTTVDLTALPHSTVPANTQLLWYTTAAHDTGTEVTNPTAVGNGTYWPVFYSTASNCFSPVGNPVVVGIATCNAACYKSGATTGGATLDGKVGISALSRAGADNPDQWPMLRKGAWLVLEAKTKGFVPNRTAFDASNNPVGIAPANFVEGMMVYDTTNKCLKIYTNNGTAWGWYCMTTQACPD